MSKPLLLFQAPVATRSGYGDHSRDILKSLFEIDKYDVKVVPTRWGNTPQNVLDEDTEFNRKVLSSIVTQLNKQPDIFIQVTVADEFKPVGKFNIGITAGVETTVAPKDFIEGCNRMNAVITPSEFTKDVLQKTRFQEADQRTKQVIREIKLERPVNVLLEGVNTEVFNGKKGDSILESVDTDFNFLFVGHWLSGDIGQDRKDVGMMIKTFCTVFKGLEKDKQPGLILKTSSAGFSVMERERLTKKLKGILDPYGDTCPPVHLVFGDLTQEEMNSLYNDEKVKAMLMFTKGEGYGRPLAEFATTGKPIIVSDWSGHKDFLPEKYTHYLEGELTEVHQSAQNKFLIQGSKWFTVNYSSAASVINQVFTRYHEACKKSERLQHNINKNFSMNNMTENLDKILSSYIRIPEKVDLKLPQIKKL
jgi:glycosyltransferase involved in cell wall biosynthesis